MPWILSHRGIHYAAGATGDTVRMAIGEGPLRHGAA